MSEKEVPSVQPSATCSFCGKLKDQIAKLFEHGSGSTICNECIALSLDIIGESQRRSALSPPPSVSQTPVPTPADRTPRTGIPLCSFCGKSHDEVDKLIAGPDVNICDNCVESYRSAMQDMINRGELNQSIFDAYYSDLGAVIEIRFRVKEDRLKEFAGARNLLRELHFEMRKLDPAIFTGIYKDDSNEPANEYRLLAIAQFLTDERVRYLKKTLDENAEQFLQPLKSFIIEAPQIRVLRELPL